MNTTSILKGAFAALCIISMMALPAAAAPLTESTATAGTVEQGLRDDLWSNHMQYRLARFDMNVRQANGVIEILNKYGIDTTACEMTLSTISTKRAGLEAALEAQDRENLRTVNEELKTLWKQFLRDVRDAVRSHYGKRAGSTDFSFLDIPMPGGS